MTMENKTPPPVEHSGDSTAVHLSYIRRDIDTINSKLDALTNQYVTRLDYDEHLKVDADHEDRIRTLEETQWKKSAYSSIISSAITAGGFIVVQYLINHSK